MNFAEAAKNTAQIKTTENGALAYDRLTSPLYTLFAQIGALRPRSEDEIAQKFASAFAQDNKLATKMMFYAGDIRGGLGERRTFRICLKWLAQNYPDVVNKNIMFISEFNRWDSILELFGTPCGKEALKLITEQLKSDMNGVMNRTGCSLLAKWLPSCNTSSKISRGRAKKIYNHLGISEKEYRKMLSKMREYIKVTERTMSANKWDKINYEAVPSYAMKNYNKAFEKHDWERFNKYKADLNTGKAKINASVLYPYDLVEKVWRRPDDISEAQWKALPNYIEGNQNVLIMADVSGSMTGRPMYTSVGLATYFAERNSGPYHNLYMTFSEQPRFIRLNDTDTLYRKVQYARETGIGYNTNLELAFKYILKFAIDNHIVPSEMPKALVVVSDMEIDRYARRYGFDFVSEMERRFAANGYTLPKLITWNVEARNDTFLSQNKNVINVSGQSTSVFKTLCGAIEGKDGYDVMLETLNSQRYDCIKV